MEVQKLWNDWGALTARVVVRKSLILHVRGWLTRSSEKPLTQCKSHQVVDLHTHAGHFIGCCSLGAGASPSGRVMPAHPCRNPVDTLCNNTLLHNSQYSSQDFVLYLNDSFSDNFLLLPCAFVSKYTYLLLLDWIKLLRDELLYGSIQYNTVFHGLLMKL